MKNIKIISSLAAGLFFFSLVNSGFAAGKVIPINWDTPKNPGDMPAQSAPEEKKESEENRVVLSDIQGRVGVLHAGQKWKAFFVGSTVEIKEGDEIGISKGSAAIIFSDGSRIELGEGTKITYSESETLIKIQLQYGKLRATIAKPFLKLKKKLEVRPYAGGFCCAVRGTDFIMENLPDTEVTTIYLNEGTLEVDDPKGETPELNSGQIAMIGNDGKIVLEKLEQKTWNELIGQTAAAETSSQTADAEKNTDTETPSKTLTWIGIIGILVVIAGYGISVYRKRS
ncbi:MAG: FecR domain-containing protein [Candidatus Paceibacterota bacterium]|jgi:hypothetical protein